ncbi:hypothetical protein ABZ914_03855 [Spirillospora sp. NPDC046719]
MSIKHQLGQAVEIARNLPSADVHLDSPATVLVELAREFSGIEFDIPDTSDADGYLFQYGKASWFPEPTFVLSVTRQLEAVDTSGGHEAYIQIQFEFRYRMDEDLASTESYSEWWFPGDGVDFEVWLTSVEQASIMNIVAGKLPREFAIWQDRA